MNTRSKFLFSAGISLFAVSTLTLLAYHDGPPQQSTAGPGEDAAGCAQARCHVGTGNPTRGSGIEIDFPDGLTYTPGVKQRWTVRVTGSQGNLYGFQVSARTSDNGQAGSFSNVDAKTQIICQTGELNQACRSSAPVQYMEHSLAGTSNSFTFEWTPPATDVGAVRVYAAGNAANGNGQESGDRIYLNSFTLTAKAAVSNAPALRQAIPVRQAFSASTTISPGTWIEIFGTNLASQTREWAGTDFNGSTGPTEMNGTKVRIGGKPAFVRYISPTQVNVQVPDGIGTGSGVSVEVETADGIGTASISAADTSVAMLAGDAFKSGDKSYVIAFYPNAQPTDPLVFVGPEGLIQGLNFRPAKPGDTIVIYAVGCGATNPASAAGQFYSDVRPLASPFQIRFGDTVAQAQGFLAPQAVGLCQFNVTVPNVASGDVPITATVGGVSDGQNLVTRIQ